MGSRIRTIVCTTLAASLFASALVAQIPDEFTNLKLLPKEISKQDLVGTMRDWAGGLGVRCNHCHVGPDNLQGMDFATDEKATKRTARKMLEMSRAINGQMLAALPTVDEGAEAQVVSCYTCHRGLSKPPRNINVQLSRVYQQDGLDAALGEFKSLREEHFGAGKYDLRSTTLNALAQRLLEGGKQDEALAVLEANRELHPDSADLEAAFGFFHLQTGDAEQAEAAFKRSLELDPENRGAQFGMSRLQAMKAAPQETEQ